MYTGPMPLVTPIPWYLYQTQGIRQGVLDRSEWYEAPCTRHAKPLVWPVDW